MRWSTLFNQLGHQPLRITQKKNVHAVLWNPKTHNYEKVFLMLRFDNYGQPYLVKDEKAQAVYEKEQDAKFRKH